LNIFLSYSAWFIFICLIVGTLYAILLYYKEKKINSLSQKNNTLKYLLFALRTLIISILCFLLLEPIIRQSYFEKLKPSIAVLIDNSASIKSKNNLNTLNQIVQELHKLNENLGKEFNIQYFTFGENLKKNNNPVYSEKQTNFDNAFISLEKEYANKNLASVVVLSDGINNAGSYSINNIKNTKTAFFTIGIGDTTPQKDIAIVRTLYNEIAYINEPLNINVECTAIDAANFNSTLNFSENGHLISKKDFKITSNVFENAFNFNFTPTKTGIYNIEFSLNSINGERNLSNNKKQISIHVTDAKKKIIFIAAQPHPDIAALRNSIINNSKFETEVHFFNENINLNNVDLVIFYKASLQAIATKQILNQLNSKNIARFFVEGEGFLSSSFNSLQNAVQTTSKAQSINEVFALINPDFQSFEIQNTFKNALNSYPPIFAPFITTNLSPVSKVILYQKIGNVSTKYPLLISNDGNTYKTGVFFAEGIWKSRIAHFSKYNNHTDFDTFWASLFQYFASKNDKRKFKVWSEKTIYNDFEAIYLNAELYNDNYNLVNTPDVNLILKNNNQSFNFIFNKTENAYTFTGQSLPNGDYTFLASTLFNSQKYTQEGSFKIIKTDIENNWLTANFNFLRLLAVESKGNFYTQKNLQNLSIDLQKSNKTKQITYTYYKNKMLLDSKWFLTFLIAILALEWFIRKYLGTY
jgi:hypothetical protein